MSDEAYIGVIEAAEILRMTERQVNRYGHEGKLQTRKAGRRVLYLKTDVEALATELDVNNRPAQKSQSTALVPAGEMLEYIRERDRKLEEVQQQLINAAVEVTRLRTQLEQQKQLSENQEGLQLRIMELEQALARARAPWYKRVLGSAGKSQ